MAPTCAVCGSLLVTELDPPRKIMCPLHVAAPDLLAACKAVQEWIHPDGSKIAERILAMVEGAIAKAEGTCGCPDPDCPGKWPGTPRDSWRCKKAEGM